MFKKHIFLYVTICGILFIFVLQNIHRNVKEKLEIPDLIPNIIHYIIFDQLSLNFITYLSVLSALKVQKPSVIYIHSNENITGNYWKKLIQYVSTTETKLSVQTLLKPTHVYGQKLSSVYHASDIARLFILRNFGGVYLDRDMIMINDINSLRIHDCVVGKPKHQYIGSQFIMAKNHSEFLKLWQEGYKKYKPRDWYYNAGQYPTEVLEKRPDLAYIETEYFGVQNLLDKLLSDEDWNQWTQYYGIHLLSRHNKVFRQLNEFTVQNMTTNLGTIVRWLLDLP